MGKKSEDDLEKILDELASQLEYEDPFDCPDPDCDGYVDFSAEIDESQKIGDEEIMRCETCGKDFRYCSECLERLDSNNLCQNVKCDGR